MIFFRYGIESFQIQRDYKQQLKKLDSNVATSLQSFEVPETDWLELNNVLNNQSLFYSTKIITLNNLFAGKNSAVENGLINELKSGTTLELPSTYLFINDCNLEMKYRAGKYQPVILGGDGRIRPLNKNQQELFLLLTQKAQLTKYYPKLKGPDMEKFLNQLIQEKDVELTPAAKKLLLELTGSNFWQIYHELNKLTNYLAGSDHKKAIDIEDVNLLVNNTTKHLFEFIEAFCNQKLVQATKLIEELFNNEDNIASGLALLNRQILQFLDIKARLLAGQPSIEIEKSLNLPKSVSQKLIDQASTLKIDNLVQLLNNLTKFNWSTKRGHGNETALFSLLTIAHAK